MPHVHYAADDRLLITAPLFHCWGLINGVLGISAVGGTAILIRRFQTEPVLDLIESAHPTILMAVPTMVNYLAKSPTIARCNLSSLRVVLSAAAPMPLELIEVLRRDWGVGYAESYGLTETSPVITTTTAREMHPGSCGRAMGDTRLKVADPLGNPLPVGSVGELWAQGTAISAGYYRRPDETARVFTPDGWFRTGDLVRIDEEGYVYIVDRVKDMINVGGEKVYPRDVEEVLHRHPAVVDAVVVGVPDPDFGELVKAYIVLKPGFAWSADEVIAHLKPILASFKLPRLVEFVAAIPRSASGKVLRRLLRSQHWYLHNSQFFVTCSVAGDWAAFNGGGSLVNFSVTMDRPQCEGPPHNEGSGEISTRAEGVVAHGVILLLHVDLENRIPRGLTLT